MSVYKWWVLALRCSSWMESPRAPRIAGRGRGRPGARAGADMVMRARSAQQMRLLNAGMMNNDTDATCDNFVFVILNTLLVHASPVDSASQRVV
jgi:hypothetical protein